MTTKDRERISREANDSEEKRYQTVHRVRSRINELEQDAEILENNHPDLYKELYDAICGDSVSAEPTEK